MTTIDFSTLVFSNVVPTWALTLTTSVTLVSRGGAVMFRRNEVVFRVSVVGFVLAGIASVASTYQRTVYDTAPVGPPDSVRLYAAVWLGARDDGPVRTGTSGTCAAAGGIAIASATRRTAAPRSTRRAATYRLRRVRKRPVPTAATAATTAATTCRLSGASWAISGPTTAMPPVARAGIWSVKKPVEETVIESCADARIITVAPLPPPDDCDWRRTCVVEFAGTVTPDRRTSLAGPPTNPRRAIHPFAATSSGFVISTSTVSAAFPEFVIVSVLFRKRPSNTPEVGSRVRERPRVRRMSTWTSTLPCVVPSVVEVATRVIVPWSTRASAGLVSVTTTPALVPEVPKFNETVEGTNENSQSVGRPDRDQVSATLPVFRTTTVYVTDEPAAIVCRWDASHVRITERETIFSRARFTTVSDCSATDVVAWYDTEIPFSVAVFVAVIA